MEDETSEEKEKPVSKKEEKALSVLEMAKQERELMEKAVEENKRLLAEMQEFRAKEILSGRSEAGQTAPKPKELTAQEYTEAWRKGEIKAKLPGT